MGRWRWLRPVVGVALLAVLAWIVDLEATARNLRGVHWPYLALLLVINTTAYVVFAMRWGYFCRRLGLHLTPGGYLRGVYLFQITSQVMPSRWGRSGG